MPIFNDQELSDFVSKLEKSNVHTLIGTYIDNAGIARAKQVPIERTSAIHRSGLGASYSWAVFSIDDVLAITPSFSVVGDMRMRADLSAARILGDGVAWAPFDIFDQEGNSLDHCPRARLRSQYQRLVAADFDARCAYEIEFTWFDEKTGDVGGGPAYGLRAMMDNEEFFADIASGLRIAGIELEQLHAEAGLGQIELSTPPLNPVEAADVLVVTRLILSRVARRHGKKLSFAPQSLNDGLGNGAHVHCSLTQRGAPIFSGGAYERGLTQEGASAIGGLLRWLPESLGVLAPSLLSSVRLLPGKWSGAWVCWGVENREAAVRLCQATPGNPHGANVEIKVTDHTANPYAALATILGFIERGIDEKIALPVEAPVNPNVFEGTADQISSFSTDQAENLLATCTSDIVRSILGDSMIEAIGAVRGREVILSAQSSREELIEMYRYTWSS